MKLARKDSPESLEPLDGPDHVETEVSPDKPAGLDGPEVQDLWDQLEQRV